MQMKNTVVLTQLKSFVLCLNSANQRAGRTAQAAIAILARVQRRRFRYYSVEKKNSITRACAYLRGTRARQKTIGCFFSPLFFYAE